MQQLSGLDSAFLAMETRAVHGHVGSICVLDPSTAPEPLTLDKMTKVIESRLPLVPAFRRRLVEVPLGLDFPYWIEDPDFDIEFHVREIALPAPGSAHQLKEQVARLHARPLDRSRPLWEIYLILGLEGGKAAVYTKVHHSAIDGVSGNEILAAVLDLSPEGRDLSNVHPLPAEEQQPSPLLLLARSALALTRNPVRAVRLSADLLRAAPTLLSTTAPRLPLVNLLINRDTDAILANAGLRAPHAPFNGPITQHRRWSFGDVSLDSVKAVKNALKVTVNDVVLALSAAALRRWLIDHEALPDAPLIAAVPVSVRTEAEKGAYGNRVSAVLAPIPTNLEDPLERLQAVHEAMRVAKEQHAAIPASVLSDVTQFALPALFGQAARLAARLRVVERVSLFNVIISNVPGPHIPLYYAGAELIAYYPLSAIADGQGLNITVFSYRDKIFFGLLADRSLVPDLDRLTDYIVDEIRELEKAVGV